MSFLPSGSEASTPQGFISQGYMIVNDKDMSLCLWISVLEPLCLMRKVL